MVPSSRGDGPKSLTEDAVKRHLKLRQNGSFDGRTPTTTAELQRCMQDAMGYHLVTVAADVTEELPVQCGCKGFQKVGQCSHIVYIAHLEGLEQVVNLEKDFNALAENKKRGRKPKAWKRFDHCLKK